MNNKNNKNDKNNIIDKNYKILKINNYTYSLFINDDEYRNILYSSILPLLRHAFHNTQKSSIFITCEKISLLSEYLLENDELLTYEQVLDIIYTLSIQINFLYEKKYGFYGIDLNDIIVINNDTFIIINDEKLLKHDKHDDENELLIIDKMIHVPFFYNPEIIEIKELPAKINHKCIYYSLALLIIHCMFGQQEIDMKEKKENMELIYSTKLYFFLERCLNNLDERCLLFV
jgi:hypothetical protein